VDTAESCPDARSRLAERRYDLLISDVLLPGGFGTELATFAKRRGAKYLLLTSHPDHLSTLQEAGPPHMTKPFLPTALIARIERLLEKEGASARPSSGSRECGGARRSLTT
jgi:DNA-binding response OmpR family regulator